MDPEILRGLLLLLQRHPWLVEKHSELMEVFVLAKTPENQLLVLALMHEMVFLKRSDYVAAAADILTTVQSTWNLTPNDTVIVSLNHDGNVNSSHELLYLLRTMRWASPDWTSSKFKNSYAEVLTIPDLKNVVLVDEFSGSGNQISRSLKWFADRTNVNGSSVNMHVALVAAMTSAENAIGAYTANMTVIHRIPKAISERWSPAEAAIKIMLMTEIEDRLQQICMAGALKRFRLGYDRSEAMYSREEGNTPNNVFPLFWWNRLGDGTVRSTLLHRNS